MNLPLVDIIIPMYNAENFIGKCLDSVLSQTYNNIRILVINDGSKDNSLSIVQKYMLSDNRIECIDQSNKGIGATRNIALNNLKGDYFYFLDSDDYISSDSIQLLIKSAIEHKADIVTGELECGNGLHLTENISQSKITTMDKQSFFDEYVFKNKLYYSVAGKIYRSDILSQIRFDDSISFGEDLLFNISLYTKDLTIAIERNALYYYVDNDDSVTRVKKPDRCFHQFKVCEGFYSYLNEIGRFEEYKFIYTELLWMCIISGIALSKKEGGDFSMIESFLEYIYSSDEYTCVDKKTLISAAKQWITIESHSFLSKIYLKTQIHSIMNQNVKLLKLIYRR